MTGAHKPLSDWVTRIDPRTTDRIGLINDGDERADARTFPLFDAGWTRLTATIGDTISALALRHEATGATVVELDDFGIPLEVDGRGANLIARLEEAWPSVEISDDDLDTLEGMSKELRYLLLYRLEQEGVPRARWFHVLPWDPVIELATATAALMDGDEPRELSSAAADLGHWVTPAVTGVTGPLERMHDGLAAGAADVALMGATALCVGLGAADPLRLPNTVRESLGRVVERLSALNPFLRHSAGVTAQHLRLSAGPATPFIARLHSEMPKAASQAEKRVQEEVLRDDGPLSVHTEVTATRRLTLTAEVALEDSDERARLVALYTAVVLPAVVRTGGESARYWIALVERRKWMSGTLTVPSPRGGFQVEADQPPVGIWGLSSVIADELLTSIRATNNAGRRVWHELAGQCVDTHPLVAALRMYAEEESRS